MPHLQQKIMHHIRETITLQTTQQTIYHIVSDIPAYPQFLPFCTQANYAPIDAHTGIGTMHIKKGPFCVEICTKNTYHPHHQINMELQEGPFKILKGTWLFHPLTPHCTQIEFLLEFELKNTLLNYSAAPILKHITQQQIQSFAQKAKNQLKTP